MLSEKLYHIGKKHNEVLKYNIDFDLDVLLDFLCSVYIEEIINTGDSLLTKRQKEKLQALLNNIGEL